MKTKFSKITPLSILLLALTATPALAVGKAQTKEEPTPPPARVESPKIPVSTTSAKNMLELRTAPDLESFAGTWTQVMSVCDLENANATGGTYRESGLAMRAYNAGLLTIKIGKNPLTVLPDKAQSQYFVDAQISYNALPYPIQKGASAPVQLHEKFVSFNVVSSLSATWRYNSREVAASYMGKYWSENSWAPGKREIDYRFELGEDLRLGVARGELTIDSLQEQNRALTYCGISANDRTLLICASNEQPRNPDRYASNRYAGYEGCATAYRRVAE